MRRQDLAAAGVVGAVGVIVFAVAAYSATPVPINNVTCTIYPTDGSPPQEGYCTGTVNLKPASSGQANSSQKNPSQANSSQTNSGQANSSQANPSQANSNQANPGLVNLNPVTSPSSFSWVILALTVIVALALVGLGLGLSLRKRPRHPRRKRLKSTHG